MAATVFYEVRRSMDRWMIDAMMMMCLGALWVAEEEGTVAAGGRKEATGDDGARGCFGDKNDRWDARRRWR
jgi:hypothetical protein